MNDPASRAIELAMARGNDDTIDKSFDRGTIRRPGNHPTSYNDDIGLDTRGDQEDLLSALRDANLEGLTDGEKNELLKQLVAKNNQHIDLKRDVQMKGDLIDLENKRKFSDLIFSFAKGFGLFAILFIMSMLALITYAVIFDKTMIDTGIVGAFFTTFTEVFKALFSVI